MNKFKKFLRKIFWIDKFEGKSKILAFFSKFAMFFYIFFLCTIPFQIIQCIISLEIGFIIIIPVEIIAFPIMYRIVMGFQRFIHGI